MPTFQIIEEKPVAMAQVKDSLEKIKERDKELNFRAGKTQEYMGVFVEMDAGKAAQLLEKLKALNIPRVKEEHLIKFVDLLPASPEEIKLILQGSPITISKENVEKIVEAITEFKK
ncbi:hypothetical protein HYS48_03170 [Candidatus Woesearchaeota archaeon]|nr:hypothetical protein [Candidatus Woesearchaeota archaeon]